MKPTEFRKCIMKAMQDNHDDRYWISTNMVDAILNAEYCIYDTSPQRVGTNLNILKRLGYVNRYNDMPVWKLTRKGAKCDLAKICF